jgi:hypothetical protein
MAKRKNSTALFEVMAAHRAMQQVRTGNGGPPVPSSAAPAAAHKYAPPPAPTVLKPINRGPGLVEVGRKWLVALLEKRREESAAAPAPTTTPAAAGQDLADPTAGVTAHSLSARSAAPPVVPPVVDPPAAPLPPAHREPAPIAEDAPAGPVTYTTSVSTYGRSARADAAPPAKPLNQVAFDRDKHEVTLKVRFTTAVISTFALLVVLGTAYILGTRAGQPKPTAKAQPAKAQSGVMDVGPKAARQGDATPANGRIPAAGRDPSAGIQPAPGGATQVTSNAAFEDVKPGPDGSARRSIGLNYCVILSYPQEMRDAAMDVAQHLNASGVVNTIEFTLPPKGRPKAGWYYITGVRGFTSPFLQSPDFRQYMQAIDAAAAKFPKKNKLHSQISQQTMMLRWEE